MITDFLTRRERMLVTIQVTLGQLHDLTIWEVVESTEQRRVGFPGISTISKPPYATATWLTTSHGTSGCAMRRAQTQPYTSGNPPGMTIHRRSTADNFI